MPARGHTTAPKFSPDQPRELRYYFNELEHLFDAASVTDEAQKKKFAIRYLDFQVADLWEGIPEFGTGDYEAFKKAILKLYPGSEEERKWTMADLDKLIGEQLRLGIFSVADFGAYHRSFVQITTFLIRKNRLAAEEQSRTFIRGIQPTLWDRFKRRLEIKNPDKHPDDPYSLDEIAKASEYVLYDPNTANYSTRGSTTSSTDQTSSNVATPSVKQEDMASTLKVFMQALEKTIEKSLAPLSNANRQQSSSSPRQTFPAGTRDTNCFMCGEPEHGVKDCEVTQDLIRAGKCKFNAEGKVVLPNGQFVPRVTPGKDLREKINEWHALHPGNIITTQATMMYSVTPTDSTSTIEDSEDTPVSYEYKRDEEIKLLERQILALRSGKRFDGVEILHKPKAQPSPPRQSQSASSSTSTNQPSSSKIVELETPSSTSEKSTQVPQQKAPQPANPIPSNPPDDNILNAPLHPFANKRTNYLPPQDKNFAAPQKSDPAYKTFAPIQSPKIVEEVYNRSMATPCVTLSTNELLSISPEVRQKVREAITPKRSLQHGKEPIAVNSVQIDSPLPTITAEELYGTTEDSSEKPEPPLEGLVVPDIYETYLHRLAPGQTPEVLTVAKESHALRSLHLMVNHQESVESIVDPGCMIVAMSEATCHDLGIIYDPRIKINMESANGELDPSLGLARNVPCQIGDIILYLQFHVIRSPAYDILLGRPFDVLTESMIKNYANEDQTITIRDPNFDRIATIPTFPRGPPKHRSNPKSRQDFHVSKL
jgi:hypothetical protein